MLIAASREQHPIEVHTSQRTVRLDPNLPVVVSEQLAEELRASGYQIEITASKPGRRVPLVAPTPVPARAGRRSK